MKVINVNCLFKKIFVVVLILMLVSIPLNASASIGGGYSNGNDTGPMWVDIPILLVIILTSTFGPILVRKYNIEKKRIKADLTLCRLSESDSNWDYEELKRDIEDAFYRFKVAWAEREMDMAKDYISRRLYDSYRIKMELMRQRKEKHILEDILLLSVIPIGLQNHGDIDRDCVWVLIKSKAIDYVINEQTEKIIKGKSDKITCSEEYWKFIRNEEGWIVDEIRQTDEVRDIDFFNIKKSN